MPRPINRCLNHRRTAQENILGEPDEHFPAFVKLRLPNIPRSIQFSRLVCVHVGTFSSEVLMLLATPLARCITTFSCATCTARSIVAVESLGRRPFQMPFGHPKAGVLARDAMVYLDMNFPPLNDSDAR